MPIESLDPQSALIVIDLQKGILSRPTAHPLADVIAKSAGLAEAFRRRGLPVVLVNVASKRAPSPDFSELVPELNRRDEDLLITKQTWGAFTNTGLADKLAEKGVTQLVITGVATSIGVESTARQAHELGYKVVTVSDAMTDVSPEAHENSLTRIFPRLGQVGTRQEIEALLDSAAP